MWHAVALSVLAAVLCPGAAILAAVSQAPADEWRLVRDGDGIGIYRQTLPDTIAPRLRARGIIGAPPRRVYEVVSDYDNFADFVPYVTLSRTLVREDAGSRRVHQRLRLPGPVADREYVLRITDFVEAAPDYRYRVQWRLDPEATANQEPVGIVPTFFSGAWELRDGPKPGTTEATYTIHFDPGGAVPDWLARLGTRRMLPEVFAAVRERAQNSHARPP